MIVDENVKSPAAMSCRNEPVYVSHVFIIILIPYH